MKKLLFLAFFTLGSITAFDSHFYTKEINISDENEVSQLAQLLTSNDDKIYDKKTKLYRNKTKDDIKHEIVQNQGKNQHLFICVSSKGHIKGALCCKYGHLSNADTVEVVTCKVFKNQSWLSKIDYWSKDNFNDVMLSMISYAENFYKNLSMKGMQVNTEVDKEVAYYVAHGYKRQKKFRKLDIEHTSKGIKLKAESLSDIFVMIILAPFLTLGSDISIQTDTSIYYKNL